MLAERGDVRKASKLLEAAWKDAPHPEEAYKFLNFIAEPENRSKLDIVFFSF